MSARTLITVREQGAYPEVGPAVQTLENADVVAGNKIVIEPNVTVWLFNSSGASKNITFGYDDEAGVVATKVVAIAAGCAIPCQLKPYLGRHAADAAEAGYAWFTASGVAGDVKMQACRQQRLS